MVLSSLVRRHDRSFVVHLLEPAINRCLYGDLCNLGIELTSQSSHGNLQKTEEIHIQKTFLDDELKDNQQENLVPWPKDKEHLHHNQ